MDDANDHVLAFDIVSGNALPNFGTLLQKANNRTYFAQGIQSDLSLEFAGTIEHKINFGVRVHEDEVDRFQWVDEYAMDEGMMELTNAGIHGTESNRIESALATSAHVQYEMNFGNWKFVPGLRYENVDLKRIDFGKNDQDRIGSEIEERQNNVQEFIPGFGATYRIDEHAQIFGGVHKGFAPPSSNKDSEAESSTNYEVGFREDRKVFNLQVVGFMNDYQNLLGSDLNASGGSGSNEMYNGGEVLSYGLEFQMGMDLLSGKSSKTKMPLSLVYTYSNAEFLSSFDSSFEGWGEVSSGDQLPYLAQHQFTFLLGLELEKMAFNFSGRYTDEMRTAPGQGEKIADQKTDSAVILDASSTYSVSENVSLFLSGTNLSDQVFIVARRPAGLRPGMPRAFTFGVKAKF